MHKILIRRLVFSVAVALFLSIVWPQAPINLEAGGIAGPQQAVITAGQVLQPIAPQKNQALESPGIILSVTDPAKQVKDTHTRKLIKDQGMDPDYVELVQDYARHLTPAEKAAKDANPQTKYLPDPSPYARTYRDRVSGKYIMETQGLPMVDGQGVPVEAGWTLQGNKYKEKNNLFKATVNGNSVELIVKNDQPDARKKGDKLAFYAQIFLNGVEQTPTGPILLDSDPVNPSYHQNTLEWDYGIAKRRIRLIEGRFLGSWVFPANPDGEVRIKYNQSGDYRLKLGQYANGTDEELVPEVVFNTAAYPFKVSDSSTFYPDAHPETASVDGRVVHTGVPSGLSWPAIRNAAGTSYEDDYGDGVPFTYYSAYSTTDTWWTLQRGILLFDTSSLQDTATITAATLSLYGYSKSDGPSPAQNPDINIYSSAPASNTALAGGDFDSLGINGFATAITYSSWYTIGYNDFTFTSLGRNNISKTSVSKFGTRNLNYDVAATSPAWASGRTGYHSGYYSEQGTGYKPKLVVTYTVPPIRFEGLKMEGVKVN